jgi:hypothetical protein
MSYDAQGGPSSRERRRGYYRPDAFGNLPVDLICAGILLHRRTDRIIEPRQQEYAMQHGLPEALGRTLAALVLAAVAVSAVVHGISVNPLMKRYTRRSPDAA